VILQRVPFPKDCWFAAVAEPDPAAKLTISVPSTWATWRVPAPLPHQRRARSCLGRRPKRFSPIY